MGKTLWLKLTLSYTKETDTNSAISNACHCIAIYMPYTNQLQNSVAGTQTYKVYGIGNYRFRYRASTSARSEKHMT